MTGTANMVLVGVLSGIVTSFLLFLFAQLVRKVIIPWYQGMVYRGIEVSGRWYTTWHTSSGITQRAQMDLVQDAGRLEGIYTVVSAAGTAEYDDIRTYDVNGSIVDGFMQLGMRAGGRKIGHIVCLLKVEGDGGRITGCSSHWAINTSRVIARDMAFFRVEASARQHADSLQAQTAPVTRPSAPAQQAGEDAPPDVD